MKIFKIIANISKCICLIILMFFISTLLVSFKLTKQDNINPFCKQIILKENIDISYDEIEKFDYKIDCSTIYFFIIVNENTSKENCISLAIEICKQIQYLKCFTHFEITGKLIEKVLYLSIDLNDLQISYVGN